jgi:hypothetical protein
VAVVAQVHAAAAALVVRFFIVPVAAVRLVGDCSGAEEAERDAGCDLATVATGLVDEFLAGLSGGAMTAASAVKVFIVRVSVGVCSVVCFGGLMPS